MEKIMSKTNDTSNLVTLDHHHTLADSELDVVTGGIPSLNNLIADKLGDALGQAMDSLSQHLGTPSWPIGW
jgi:hypothetical protein